jgi:hypothetical protein
MECDNCTRSALGMHHRYCDSRPETTYMVIRKYKTGHHEQVILQGCSLQEVQQHCSDKQSSSTTCTSKEGILNTLQHGPWFDCYYEE